MRFLATILGLGMLLVAVPGMLTPHTVWAKEPISTDGQGLAIKGYDPVAYFTEGKPLMGSEAFSHEWMGAQWRFATAEHLGMFKSNAEKYVPQYGGY
jgi:YHS domain-containing protein